MEPLKIIESIKLENGLEIDLDEGWRKLTTSQFGGSPGRSFSELIQNAIDSYPSGTPWDRRNGSIVTKYNTISISDYGEGFNLKRLELLATIGGTDKLGDEGKLGRFGLGFISIFNPNLKTSKVVVTTRCEGHVVEMTFSVTDPFLRPKISFRLINATIDYSTRILVEFTDTNSVGLCLTAAKASLEWYPCPITINGKLFASEWQKGLTGRFHIFSENNCNGLVRKGSHYQNISILCKYELVMRTNLTHFINGGYNMKNDLNDYESTCTPYVPDIEIVFNINNLNLVISRDNYYMDYYYTDARKILIKNLREFLAEELKINPSDSTILANQFIFRHELNTYLKQPDDIFFSRKENLFLKSLAEAKVYRINGRSGSYSFIDMKKMLSQGLPVWYSPERTNLRWLGGTFRHDFIVIPENPGLFSNSAELFDRIFESVFDDVVNLDTIFYDQKKITELVNRGVIDKEALSPKCQIIGTKTLDSSHADLISDLAMLLEDPEIKDVIGSNLHLDIDRITPVFFSISEEGAWLSTGVFDQKGKPVSEEFTSNIVGKSDSGEPGIFNGRKTDLLLGLNIDHPMINFLTTSLSPHKEYYTLTFLAHELALCQKILVPYSPFYHLVKQKLAQEMRKVLMKNLLLQLNN